MYQGKYYSTTFNLCACRVRMTELNTLVTCSRHTAWWRNKTWLIDIWSPYIRQSTWKVHRIMSWSRTLTRNLKNFRAETCILKTMWEKMQALYFVKGGIHRTLKIGLKCYDSHKALQLSLTIRAGKAWESSFMSFFFVCVRVCGGGHYQGIFPKGNIVSALWQKINFHCCFDIRDQELQPEMTLSYQRPSGRNGSLDTKD